MVLRIDASTHCPLYLSTGSPYHSIVFFIDVSRQIRIVVSTNCLVSFGGKITVNTAAKAGLGGIFR